jgi:hypothetical protein
MQPYVQRSFESNLLLIHGYGTKHVALPFMAENFKEKALPLIV